MHRSSYCGVNCEKCKVYLATTANDDSLKQKVADEWSILYKRTFSVDDMVCYGCKSGTLFSLCFLCDIPACNKEHNSENCEDCVDFTTCERIQRFFDYHKNNDTGAVF